MNVKPVNYLAWAIGERTRVGTFRVRRIVWGLTMARAERRSHEEIRAAQLTIEREWKPRHPKPRRERKRLVPDYPLAHPVVGDLGTIPL